MFFFLFFFFKQKTAYEMRISDWSSDVCSSDLGLSQPYPYGAARLRARRISLFRLSAAAAGRGAARDALCAARADREPLARAQGDGCPLSGRTWRITCVLLRCGAGAAVGVGTSIRTEARRVGNKVVRRIMIHGSAEQVNKQEQI